LFIVTDIYHHSSDVGDSGVGGLPTFVLWIVMGATGGLLAVVVAIIVAAVVCCRRYHARAKHSSHRFHLFIQSV